MFKLRLEKTAGDIQQCWRDINNTKALMKETKKRPVEESTLLRIELNYYTKKLEMLNALLELGNYREATGQYDL